ncbi:acetyltransferase [Persicimonas caeni]|uniref:Acetyltransferase n=1 Tax=Persicimonas caeni TaxID=2292766 RepID=A0A4Y6PTW0_PERCE|nr:acetyltransferase [Persicimonas caeni]QDG51673.1 acetyltransferase [Persicimonas caeni]QED32894.1 acetyltransferase [Persicimonas caeni]
MSHSRRFIVVGAGGHGKVVADAIRASGDRVAGFVDIDPAKLGQVVEPGGAAVICSQGDFFDRVSADSLDELGDAVAFGVGNNRVRSELLARLPNELTPPVVHPGAIVSSTAKLGSGTVVFAGAVINAAAVIGSGVIVNSAAVIEHDCRIGDGAHLSPNTAVCGGSTIGQRTWVGAGSTVIHQVCVGDDVVIGAGAVIIRDVPAKATVVGNPGKVIKQAE